MAKISKDIKGNEEKPSDDLKMAEENLTPWQRENLEYMKQQGDEPVWQPSLLRRKPKEDPQPQEEEQIETKTEEISTEVDQEAEKKKISYESFADRLPNIKKERNHRLYRRLTLIVSILLGAVIVALYFVSPLSKLGNITVAGNENIDSEVVIEKSGLSKGQGVWEQFLDKEIYEKKIKRIIPRVRNSTISLNGINSFKINITEYEVVALEAEGEKYHPVLENGKILKETVHTPESGKLIFENFKDEGLIKELMNSYAELSSEIKQGISEIRYAPSKVNKELVNLYMNDGNKVIVNIPQLAEKMSYYPQIANQMEQKGTIDMEVGIFSYPYGSESSTEALEEQIEENSEPLDGNQENR